MNKHTAINDHGLNWKLAEPRVVRVAERVLAMAGREGRRVSCLIWLTSDVGGAERSTIFPRLHARAERAASAALTSRQANARGAVCRVRAPFAGSVGGRATGASGALANTKAVSSTSTKMGTAKLSLLIGRVESNLRDGEDQPVLRVRWNFYRIFSIMRVLSNASIRVHR